MEEVIKVENNQGLRLDLFLVFSITQFSRSEIKRKINNGDIKVNGTVEFRPHYKMRLHDEVVISLNNPPDLISENFIIPKKINLDIIYEDKDLLIINKPAGLVVHPATGHKDDTLMNGVVYMYSELNDIGVRNRSSLIHRLDKETSGLILVGKTNMGLWYYSRLFADKKVTKTYLAVVRGDIRSRLNGRKELLINTIHARNKLNRMKFSSRNDYEGKPAITLIRFLHFIEFEGEKFSVVAAFPKTGRTHQIRVHLSELGFPIIGDQIYGKNKYSRLMLHAWKIKLTLLNKNEKEFITEVPSEFLKFMK